MSINVTEGQLPHQYEKYVADDGSITPAAAKGIVLK